VAEEVQIAGTQETGKIRNPLGVIGLMFITLGIYGIFWYYFINKELAEIGKARGTDQLGTSPGTSVLAVTLGAFIIVPPFVSMYKTWKRLEDAQRLTGNPDPFSAGLGFILSLFIGPVGTYLLQDNMNKVLQAQAGGTPALPAQPAQPAQAASPQAQQPQQ
jgi:hypothetical protein